LRLVVAALVLIVLTSFYHEQVSDLFSLSLSAESRVYRFCIFCAAAIGSYGVVTAAFGLVLSPLKNEAPVRLLPVLLGISALIYVFFYLLTASFDAPVRDEQRRLRPGESINI
jgi:hypothetical protein